MKKTRQEVFETNSSSTHSLTVGNTMEEYTPEGKYLKIEFIDTDDYRVLTTLQEKVSYLTSQIINKYKWNAPTYEELIEEVEDNLDFRRISRYVEDTFGKQIVFPEKYTGELEEIVNINHQIVMRETLDELLTDIVDYDRDLLEEVLNNGKYIEFGRD